jgi:hypothetical protein
LWSETPLRNDRLGIQAKARIRDASCNRHIHGQTIALSLLKRLEPMFKADVHCANSTSTHTHGWRPIDQRPAYSRRCSEHGRGFRNVGPTIRDAELHLGVPHGTLADIKRNTPLLNEAIRKT